MVTAWEVEHLGTSSFTSIFTGFGIAAADGKLRQPGFLWLCTMSSNRQLQPCFAAVTIRHVLQRQRPSVSFGDLAA